MLQSVSTIKVGMAAMMTAGTVVEGSSGPCQCSGPSSMVAQHMPSATAVPVMITA